MRLINYGAYSIESPLYKYVTWPHPHQVTSEDDADDTKVSACMQMLPCSSCALSLPFNPEGNGYLSSLRRRGVLFEFFLYYQHELNFSKGRHQISAEAWSLD